VYQQHDGGEGSLNKTTPRPHIDLKDLTDRSNGYSHSELVRLIEERQEELILELCGPKYSRSHPYKRAGTYTKTLVTSLGSLRGA